MSITINSSTVDDTECLEQALREHRESSWDDRDFVNLPPDIQHVILQRAQAIKDRETRLHVGHVTNITGK